MQERQELRNHTVLILSPGPERASGGGCLLDDYHILTCRRLVEKALSLSVISPNLPVLVSPIDDPQHVADAVVEQVGENFDRDLVLLRLTSPIRVGLQPAEFSNPLHYLEKPFEVLGNSPGNSAFTGLFGNDETTEGKVWMKSDGTQPEFPLAGAPVWSDAVGAFLGIVGFPSEDSPNPQCITSRTLCNFYPELPVRFRIIQSDRPPVTNFNLDDPNSDLFGTTSDNGQRRLTATVEKRQADGYASVRLTYEAIPNSPKPRGKFVTFVTYPDMPEYEVVKELDSNGKADVEYKQPFIPDFTVAAIGDAGDTRLTLNLANLTTSPPSNPPPTLPPASPFVSGPAGFAREFCAIGRNGKVKDQLNVDDLAKRLAELIALRETQLPLALGLFGNWGSGKSHFMNLMDQHISQLARESREDWARRAQEPQASTRPDPTNQGPWAREIVSVHFNAWHYVDANLWASLISQIFESLFTHLSPRQNELEKVQDLLKDAAGATARAAEELSVAKGETVRANEELTAARNMRESNQSMVDGMLFGLDRLLPNVTTEQLRKCVAGVLNDQTAVKTLDQLQEVVAEAKTLQGRGRTLWNSFWNAPGRGWRLGWLFGVVGATVLVPQLLIHLGWVKVVDVLQAVHLLLAFPLFAVVVGVDQRFLRQSLLAQFKGLLASETVNGRNLKSSSNRSDYAATSLDYLEKIFHVPLHLPPMEKTGFGNLIEDLTEPPAEFTAAGEMPPPARDERVEHKPAVAAPIAARPQAFDFDEETATRPSHLEATEPPPPAPSTPTKTDLPPVAPAQVPRVIGSVPLTRWERDALKDYYSLIQTPRGAKRLLNTYRLVRAGIPNSEWRAFCGDEKNNGEFRLVMLLLAAAAGSPAVAQDWFAALRTEGHPPGEWSAFKQLFDETDSLLNPKPTPERLDLWIDRVELFTF